MTEARVIHEGDVPTVPIPGGGGSYRQPIDGAAGARQLVQRVVRYEPGVGPDIAGRGCEFVAYVVAGTGRLDVEGSGFDLGPGIGLFVPPGSGHRFEADGDGLLLVAVLSPPPDGAAERGDGRPPATVHEHDRPAESAGEDRSFRVLIDPRSGCRNVTQFVGSIRRSRAPFHTHTYEEAIHVLDGDGIVHAGSRSEPVRAGCSVFLPPGVPHCLENAGPTTLRLLGVFSPAGSPADKRVDP